MSHQPTTLRDEVRRKYAEAASPSPKDRVRLRQRRLLPGRRRASDFGEALYTLEQRGELPDAAALASLGCGNPTAVAELREGEVVLDLGSGGGIDVILSAKRVGPTGLAFGLDMTDEMLALARSERRRGRDPNAIFLKGADRARCRCPPTRSTSSSRTASSTSRPTRPRCCWRSRACSSRAAGVGVSDIVAEDRLSPEERAERGSYVGCIAGALSKCEYEVGLEAAGFEDVSVEFTHEVADGIHGAIVKAVKATDPRRGALPVVEPATQRRLLLMAVGSAPTTIEALRRRALARRRPRVRGRASRRGTRRSRPRCRPGTRGTRPISPSIGFVALRDGEVVGWAARHPVSGRCCYAGVVENSVYVAETPAARASAGACSKR